MSKHFLRHGAGENRKRAPFLLVLIIMSGILLLVPIMLFAPSFNAGYLNQLFLKHAQVTTLPLEEDHHQLLSRGLADYLSGRQAEAQVHLMVQGQQVTAFQGHEIQHLQDVRLLALLAKLLFWAALAMLLAGMVWCLLRYRARPVQAAATLASALQQAALVLGGLLLLLTVFVVIDFESAFILLHEVVFQNELWLLDPGQDVLIQLMPEPFFVDYALRVLRNILLFLGLAVLLPGLVLFVLKGRQKHQGQSSHG